MLTHYQENKQLKEYNKHASLLADSLCLYFHDASMYSEAKVNEAFHRYKNLYIERENGRQPRIKHLYIVVNDIDRIIEIE